ncbi:MAG: PfkB family carbohydrate kinase [Kofleriaceae bacterium]
MTQPVVVWGEVLWDRFPDGAQLGGAPSNLAWHLGQAGGWAQLVSRVGDDAWGRRATAELAAFVDTSLVQVDPARATGEVEITLEAGEPRYRLVPGRAWEHLELTAAARAALADAGAFVYGTLAQRAPDGRRAWQQALAALPPGCLRVCDPNLRPADLAPAVLAEALDGADILKVNERELGWIGEALGWRAPLDELRDRRRRVIAVTRGAAGSTIYADGRVVELEGRTARPGGDHVGCGDAYLAILVHGASCGWDLEDSGAAASRWAAEVASRRGATPTFGDDLVAELLGCDD